VLDQTTGVATTIVPMAYPAAAPNPRISAMKFEAESGQLFGYLKSDNGTFLAKIDPVTGAVTIIGAATVSGMDGIAWGVRR
jgi:hypothetical protein